VAAFLFVATVIAAVVGISLLFPNRLMDRLWELNKPGAALFPFDRQAVRLIFVGSWSCYGFGSARLASAQNSGRGGLQ